MSNPTFPSCPKCKEPLPIGREVDEDGNICSWEECEECSFPSSYDKDCKRCYGTGIIKNPHLHGADVCWCEPSSQAGGSNSENLSAEPPASSEETLKNAKELQRGSVIPSRPERVRLGYAIEKMYEENNAMRITITEWNEMKRTSPHYHKTLTEISMKHAAEEARMAQENSDMHRDCVKMYSAFQNLKTYRCGDHKRIFKDISCVSDYSK